MKNSDAEMAETARLNDESIARRREDLERRREELQRRCDAIRKDYRRGLSADSQDRAVELENAETLAEILRVSELTLAEVEKELRALLP